MVLAIILLFQKNQLIAIKLLLHFIFAINCNQIGPKPASITARKCKNGVECCCSLMDNASFLAKMKVFNHEGYDDEKI